MAEPPGQALQVSLLCNDYYWFDKSEKKEKERGKEKGHFVPVASVVCTVVAETVDPGPLKAFGNQVEAAGPSLAAPAAKLVPLLLPLCPSQELQDHRWPSSRTAGIIRVPMVNIRMPYLIPPSKDTHFIDEETEAKRWALSPSIPRLLSRLC